MTHHPPTYTCQDVIDVLVDLADGHGPDWAQQHAQTCATCSMRVAESRMLHRTLRSMPQIALPDDFSAALQAKLQARAPQQKEEVSWLRTWRMALALPALATVLFAIVWLRMSGPAAVHIQSKQQVNVEIDIEAAQAMHDVAMRIELPKGLELVTEDPNLVDLHMLAWNESFVAGKNHFSFVLRAATPGEHRVHVAASADGQQAAMDVVVRVENPQEHAWLEMPDLLPNAVAMHMRLEMTRDPS